MKKQLMTMAIGILTFLPLSSNAFEHPTCALLMNPAFDNIEYFQMLKALESKGMNTKLDYQNQKLVEGDLTYNGEASVVGRSDSTDGCDTDLEVKTTFKILKMISGKWEVISTGSSNYKTTAYDQYCRGDFLIPKDFLQFKAYVDAITMLDTCRKK